MQALVQFKELNLNNFKVVLDLGKTRPCLPSSVLLYFGSIMF
jgi:hypothetical protein